MIPNAEFIADTNVIIDLSKGDTKAASQIEGKTFAITFITMAELALGVVLARKQYAAALDVYSSLDNVYCINSVPQLGPGRYALICAELRKIGKMIPQNDLWIAVIAIETKLPVLTRDGHFDRVPGLAVIHY